MDERITITNNAKVPFTRALYGGCCSRCDGKLEWEALFDADGTDYAATCCGFRFRMVNATMRCSVKRDT